MKTGNDFCSMDKFRELLEKSNGGEFELNFTSTNEQYMIIRCSDCLTFQRCDSFRKGSGEVYYKTLDEIFEKGEIDGFVLKDNWQYLYAIIIDGTFELDEYCERFGIELS